MARVKKAEEIRLLAPIIDEQTLKEENQRRRRPNTFHASSILDCARKQWYGLKGYPADPSTDNPQWKRDASAGEAIHEQYQDLLLRSGVVLATEEFLTLAGWTRGDYPDGVKLPQYALEVPLPPNAYRIGGRIDAVVRVAGADWIIDIKTVKLKDYDAMVPSHYKMKKYMAQLQIYMHLTGIRRSAVWLICRNDSLMREFEVFYDPAWCASQFARIAELEAKREAGVLPAPEPNRFACGFCPFISLCADDIS